MIIASALILHLPYIDMGVAKEYPFSYFSMVRVQKPKVVTAVRDTVNMLNVRRSVDI
jgi:hypothetical protein